MDATERQVVPTDGDEDAELDLLIDLLADSSGSSPKSTSHGLSHESASKDAAYVDHDEHHSPMSYISPTEPPNESNSIVFEGLRQSTPIPRRYSSAAPATPFSPDAHEEFLPQVPPMAPHIPAVRSVTHLSNPSPLGAAALTTPRSFPVPVASVVTDIPAHHTSSGRNPPPQTTFRIPMAALHAINPELLPVSPFLLSPTLATGTLPGQNVSTIARDGSRSPFFVQLSPTSSPPLRMRSLSQASIEATRDPNTLLSPPNIQVRGSTHHLAMSVGSRGSTMDQLAMDLEYARAELSAAHQECERLRQLVQDHLEPNDSPGERIKPGVNISSESQLPQEGVQKEALVLERQESLTAALSTQVEAPSTPQRSRSPFVRPENSPPLIKDIESLTERQAKDKLSEILTYLALPASALDEIPSVLETSAKAQADPSQPPQPTRNPAAMPVFSPTPLPFHAHPHSRSRPSSRTSSRPPPVSSVVPPAAVQPLPSVPKSFPDLKRALSFVQLADELVWKRALLASYGVAIGSTGPIAGAQAKRHVAPVDFLRLRDGQTVTRNRETGSIKTQAEAEVDNDPDVFGEANLIALRERLGLWERAIRSRPSGAGHGIGGARR